MAAEIIAEPQIQRSSLSGGRTRNKSVVAEARDIRLAIELIELGARLQMLEAETNLSRERLLKLYKEVKGESPPKGMLPFSTDWFMTWQPNIHASLFMSYFRFMQRNTKLQGLELIIKAYRMYLEQIKRGRMDVVLSLTRAWTMVRFFDAKMLQTSCCKECGGEFVSHAYDPTRGYVCGLCHMPARAGKTRKAVAAAQEAALQAATV